MNTDLINRVLAIQGFDPIDFDDSREMALIRIAYENGELDMVNKFASRCSK